MFPGWIKIGTGGSGRSGLIEFGLTELAGLEDKQLILKALTYFADADADTEVGRIKVLDPHFSWEAVKQEIYKQVQLTGIR